MSLGTSAESWSPFTPGVDAHPRRFSFLPLASSLGRTAAAFLIASNFAFLFAPLLYLVNRLVNPSAGLDRGDPGSVAVAVLSDSMGIYTIGEILIVIGGVLLSAALFLVLLGLDRSDRKTRLDAFVVGGAALACIVGWTVATAYAQTLTREMYGLEAMVATGGWSTAAVLLFVASLLYVVFRVRAGLDTRGRWMIAASWPVFAGVALIGTAVLGSSFRVARDPALFVTALAVEVIVLPLLGIVAYRDLGNGFPAWRKLDRTKGPPQIEVEAMDESDVLPGEVPAEPAPTEEVVEPDPPPPENL